MDRGKLDKLGLCLGVLGIGRWPTVACRFRDYGAAGDGRGCCGGGGEWGTIDV